MLFWLGILPALFWQFALALLYLNWPASEQTQFVYWLAKAWLVIWPLVWWRVLIKRLPKTKPNRTSSTYYGLITGLMIVGSVSLFSWLTQSFLLTLRPSLQLEVAQFGLSANSYIVFALVLAILHSAFEEWYWRSFVFRGLRLKLNWALAAAVSSVAFASHHLIVLLQFSPVWFSILGAAAIGLAGYLWCYQYQRTNSLLGSWLSHLLADLVVMVVGYWIIFS